MTTKRILPRIIVICTLAVTVAHGQTPLGTGFTYQGQLRQDNLTTDGTADFQFRLFPSLSGGTQVGTTQAKNGVQIKNGLFTVDLDFGASAFIGDKRFLEIGVRSPAGSGSFTTLSPRQPLNAAPYALFALSVPGGVSDGHSLDAADGSPTDALFVDNSGNIGIGTTVPLTRLHLASGDFMAGAPGEEWMFHTRSHVGSDFLHITDSDNGVPQFQRGLTLHQNGNVGIAQTGPQAKLHISNGDILAGAPGAEWIFHTRSTFDSDFLHITDSDNGTYQFQRGLTVHQNGGVGIGTTAPTAGLHITKEPFTSAGTLALEGSTHSYISFYPQGAAAGRKAWFGYGGAGVQDITLWNEAGGDINLVTASGAATKVNVLEIAGADLAEKFPTSETLEPGMVAAIDTENPGKLCLARGAYNPRVAGIVSGANDFPVGAVLGCKGGNDDGLPIALTGRVYVWCDAATGTIQPGDMLTTSETPGHAMKATDRERLHGAVLGKAMTRLEQGQQGLVLTLVNLQ